MNLLLSILFIGGLGFKETLIIAVIILLLFGGKKIPELMKGLGTGIKEFKKSVKDNDENEKNKDENNESEKSTK